MKDLLSVFTNSNILLAVIALFVIVVAVLAFFITKKFGIKYINAAESIVNFARGLLLQLGFDNAKTETILETLLQAVSYALTLNASAAIEDKVKVSFEFFNKLLLQLGNAAGIKINLDDNEISILETVFKLTFIFINTLGISKKHIKYQKLSKPAVQAI